MTRKASAAELVTPAVVIHNRLSAGYLNVNRGVANR